jgi:hypothetical protein
MNRHGPHNGASVDEEESSGVTSLAPVPIKTMRLSGLHDADRTQYFSVNTLLERGRTVAAREQANSAVGPLSPARMAEVSETPAPMVKAQPPKPSIWQQIQQASLARKASAVLLLLLTSMLVLKPSFKKPRHGSLPAPSAAASVALPAPALPTPQLAATPPEPPPTLPRGVSLEKASADSVAAGDFQRAGRLYRELLRREPQNAAYREALRILERRAPAPGP